MAPITPQILTRTAVVAVVAGRLQEHLLRLELGTTGSQSVAAEVVVLTPVGEAPRLTVLSGMVVDEAADARFTQPTTAQKRAGAAVAALDGQTEAAVALIKAVAAELVDRLNTLTAVLVVAAVWAAAAKVLGGHPKVALAVAAHQTLLPVVR